MTFLKTLHILALVALGFTQFIHADDAPTVTSVAQDHFVWPKELYSLDWDKNVDVTIDLPYLSLDGSPKPKVRAIYYVDLNDDGEKEMILCLGRDGKTRDFAIFQHKDNQWKEIGVFLGLCEVYSIENGYYQLGSELQYGGGSTGHTLYRFIHGRYRPVAIKEYESGTLKSISYDPAGMEDDPIIYEKE